MSTHTILHGVLIKCGASDVDLIVGPRASRIIAHYERTWERMRGRTHLRYDALVSTCMAQLAGANGDTECDQRTAFDLTV